MGTKPFDRAVGAGPAGPAAAGPIFSQLTRAKNAVCHYGGEDNKERVQ